MRHRRFRPRETFFAGALNWIRAELRRLGRWTASPPLEVLDGPAGRHVRNGRPQPFPARITGGSAGSGYDWQEIAFEGSGGDTDQGREGEANAWEVNGQSVPTDGSAIVWLRPSQSVGDDFRFQYHRKGGGCCDITLYVFVQCNGGPNIIGAHVTVYDSEMEEVASGTTVNGDPDGAARLEWCGFAATYTIRVNLVIAGIANEHDEEHSVVCGENDSITVNVIPETVERCVVAYNCPDAIYPSENRRLLPGATIGFYQGMSLIADCVTGETGDCCAELPFGESFDVEATHPSYSDPETTTVDTEDCEADSTFVLFGNDTLIDDELRCCSGCEITNDPPATLTLTDEFGAHTLTYISGSSPPVWRCCYFREGEIFEGPITQCQFPCPPVTGEYCISYQLTCAQAFISSPGAPGAFTLSRLIPFATQECTGGPPFFIITEYTLPWNETGVTCDDGCAEIVDIVELCEGLGDTLIGYELESENEDGAYSCDPTDIDFDLPLDGLGIFSTGAVNISE